MSVSDADRDIPTLGSTDIAETSVNLVSDITPSPSGLRFPDLRQRPMLDLSLGLFSYL